MRLWDFVLRLMPVWLGSPEWLETLCGSGTCVARALLPATAYATRKPARGNDFSAFEV